MTSAPSKSTTSIQRAWYRWKALRLPWRKKFLVGLDLSGNTYWEFRDKLSSNRNRMRRIVKYTTEVPYADVASLISPAWHQWLRHTRRDPPSLTEQAQDILRQERLKVLAAQADARWAEKPSVLDPPRDMSLSELSLNIDKRNKTRTASTKGSTSGAGIDRREGVVGESELGQDGIPKTDNPETKMQNLDEKRHSFIPGIKTKGSESIAKSLRGKTRGPGEEWQPQAWDPNTTATEK